MYNRVVKGSWYKEEKEKRSKRVKWRSFEKYKKVKVNDRWLTEEVK